jgi:phage terminase large subunit-like protein
MKWHDFSARLSSALSASSAAGKLREDLSELNPEQLKLILAHWPLWARPDQLPPAATSGGESWRVWLILGGRGAGKTRAGAEWVRTKALARAAADAPGVRRIALVGETFADVRRVMIEGQSGLLAVHHASERPRFEPSKGQMIWPSGAIAQVFSAEDPDSLRGPQFDAAWCDEVAKWRHPQRTWDMLQFALRLGEHPQMVATTTPRSTPFLKKLIADAGTVVTRAATADNADNLAPSFVAEMTRRYHGTALGRQELLGELVDDTSGALWRRDWIETQRVTTAPELSAIVVAVDPPVTATAASDACGIVVAGLGPDGRAYVVADRTLQGREPQVWCAGGDRRLWRFPRRPRGGRGQPGRRSGRHGAEADRRERRRAHGAGDARQVASSRAGGGALRRGACGARRQVRGAGGSDVRVRRRWVGEGPLARSARCAGVGVDGFDGRRRAASGGAPDLNFVPARH